VACIRQAARLPHSTGRRTLPIQDLSNPHPSLSFGQSLLRNRSVVRFCLAHVWISRWRWAKVQAIYAFVNDRLVFWLPVSPGDANRQRGDEWGLGVCRDFTHSAITLCRCLNIPARYCNGFLGDVGVKADPAPMDFNAWFEAFLGGRWFTFDARRNRPRIGRVLIALGRDAADIPMIATFGPHRLIRFVVTTEELKAATPFAA